MLLFWNKAEIEFYVSYLLDVASLAARGRESRGCCLVWLFGVRDPLCVVRLLIAQQQT